MKNDVTKTPAQKTSRSAWEKAEAQLDAWRNAQEKVKADWREAWEFDRRGICLSALLLLAAACTLALAVAKQQSSTILAVVFLFVFLSNFYFMQILKHRFSERVAGVFAQIVVLAGFVVFVGTLALPLADVSPDAGVLAIAGAVAGAGVLVGAAAGAVALALAFVDTGAPLISAIAPAAVLVGAFKLFSFIFAGVVAAAGAGTVAAAISLTFAVAGAVAATFAFDRPLDDSSAGAFALGAAVAAAVAVAVAVAVPVAGAAAGAVASDFAGVATSAVVSVFAAAVFFALVFAVFFAFVFVFVFALVFFVVFFVALAVVRVILQPHLRRAFFFFHRAQEFKEKEPERGSDYEETTTTRRARRTTITELQQQERSLTLGLAGRRGLGKTALLRYFLQEKENASSAPTSIKSNCDLKDEEKENASSAPTPIKSDRDLKDEKKVEDARLRCLTLFVATPTESAEQVFLMALLERLAQKFNQALTRLLPSVQPFKVEQELREKRRLLRGSHVTMLGLILLSTGMSFYYLNATNRAPVLRQFFFKPDSTAAKTFSPPGIYTKMRDSLFAMVRVQATSLQNSLALAQIDSLALAQIDSLSISRVTKNSWNLKGKYSRVERKFLIQAILDSLTKSRAWPKLNPLQRTWPWYQAIWDSSIAVSSRYQDNSDSVALPSESSLTKEASLWQFFGWLLFNCVLLLALPFVYWRTREGESRFTKGVYVMVRNEIALYERTNALLERLHFQMSFGESREAGLAFSRSGWQLTHKISKQVQRQARPYTTMSLIDEFRDYISDAKMYLNDALKMHGMWPQERFQIVIAIDELDKILDTDKLHNMLKSMKAIFEIEDVYYILSISEDALETYRLRHVDTKNEIDSAFTHIISLPPMDAEGSLTFYIEHHHDWAPCLLPAAIVFGGGVPRDMHRLSQLFGTYKGEPNLEQCLKELVKEDISACNDMILLNAHLSDEGKQVWLKILDETGLTSKEKTEELLGKIEAYVIDDFIKMNLCAGDKAKEQFHRLRSLIRGVVVKGFIYDAVPHNPTPTALASWPRESKREYAELLELTTPAERASWPPRLELKSFMERLLKEDSLGNWLAQLEPLRDAIFELSRNPLRVWENLTKSPTVK